jgi:hypothetical protein
MVGQHRYLTPGAILDSESTWLATQTYADGILLRLGTDGDIASVLRAATLNANTALTGVLVGTPVTLAMPANTCILSNITADGDIVLAVNNGGNSLEGIRIDASVPEVVIGHGMAVRFSGAIDLNNQGSIINIGAAGNDWTQNAITLAGGTASQVLTIDTSSTTTESSVRLVVGSGSTSNAGPNVTFREGTGLGSANNNEYVLGYSVNNAYMRLNTQDANGSGLLADVWRIPDGQVSIDANTTWDINVFDDYDDAMVLSPYRNGVLNLAARREELVRMGVLRRYSDGWIGHNDQRMEALLAGGIYQTRERMDIWHKESEFHFSTIEERLQAVEEANRILTDENAELKALMGRR